MSGSCLVNTRSSPTLVKHVRIVYLAISRPELYGTDLDQHQKPSSLSFIADGTASSMAVTIKLRLSIRLSRMVFFVLRKKASLLSVTR